MKTYFLPALFLLFFLTAFPQEENFTETQLSIGKFTDGTLTLPIDTSQVPLVIFIQGSGPTNRDGNQSMAKNDGVKKIAHQLAQDGIASFRFDKRIFKMTRYRIQEEDLRFDDFVKDLNEIIRHFKSSESYSKIILAGHSEGALIAKLAAQQENVDALISLAGAGRSIDEIIVEQLSKQSKEMAESAATAFAEIKKTGKTTNYSPFLESIFRPSVQPYMGSWLQYKPVEEVAKLEIPVLIVTGSADLQVDPQDAELLHEAQPNSQLVILEKMNHIFREIQGDNLENSKTYNEPGRPLHPELMPTLTDFIKSLN